jgi:hypothetical protein
MTVKRFKKWHIASAVAVLAVLALIVVLLKGNKSESKMIVCPSIPVGDPLTSFTQSQDSNCTVTCSTTDANATVAQDQRGACRSTCKVGYVKSLLTGSCTVSTQSAQSNVDNMKLQLISITDPAIRDTMTKQIAFLQSQIDSIKSSASTA